MNACDTATAAHFNELATSWWDPEGPMAALHHINPTRLAAVAQHVPLDGMEVLDVGCGGGLLSEAMAQQGARVTGLDPAPDLVAVASHHASQAALDVDYHAATLGAWAPAHPDSYDLITCMELLEHVEDPELLIAEAALALKPGGWWIGSTLDRTPGACLTTIVAAEYLFQIVPRGTHRYRQYIRPSELLDMLERQGFSLVDHRGMVYNPCTRQAHITPPPQHQYMMFARLTNA